MNRRDFVGGLFGTVASAGLVDIATGATPTSDGDTLEEIEILTDDDGESHVYADSLYALGYGNGYVQARDRAGTPTTTDGRPTS